MPGPGGAGCQSRASRGIGGLSTAAETLAGVVPGGSRTPPQPGVRAGATALTGAIPGTSPGPRREP